MQLTVDLSHLPLDVRRKVVRNVQQEDQAKLALARVRQIKMAKLYNDLVDNGTTRNGIGPVSMVVDPFWASYFRRVHGETIWNDPDFAKHLQRKGEPFFVRQTGTRVQVGYGDCRRPQKVKAP